MNRNDTIAVVYAENAKQIFFSSFTPRSEWSFKPFHRTVELSGQSYRLAGFIAKIGLKTTPRVPILDGSEQPIIGLA